MDRTWRTPRKRSLFGDRKRHSCCGETPEKTGALDFKGPSKSKAARDDPLDRPRAHAPGDDLVVREQGLVQGDVGADAADDELVEGAPHPRDGLLPGRAVRDD